MTPGQQALPDAVAAELNLAPAQGTMARAGFVRVLVRLRALHRSQHRQFQAIHHLGIWRLCRAARRPAFEPVTS